MRMPDGWVACRACGKALRVADSVGSKNPAHRGRYCWTRVCMKYRDLNDKTLADAAIWGKN